MATVQVTDSPENLNRMPITYQDAVQAGIPLRWPRWGIWDAVIAIVGFMALTAVVAVPLYLTDAPVAVVVLVGGTVPWLMLAGWPIFITWRRGNGVRIDLGVILRWSDVGWGLVFGVAGLFLAGIGAVITMAIVGDFNSAAGEAAQVLVDSSPFAAVFIFAVVIAVGAPIVEELAFRGLLFGSLAKRGIKPLWVVVITALVFSLFHLEPTRILVLLPIGITLGLARWKTRGLGAPMIAHTLNNLPAAVFLLIGAPEVTP
ncbi:MAG: CPBP family intramembrane metalloprotease [Candidatus Nanopelagicales bacterium]|nr:CPBP family intramembrane metalloprotease [Candidatus Nanopelagicales bacterium]MCF8551172.1 CPBP family intramembrane metalloprotease [Candidatus Nanopelagicales bacterium]